MWLVLPAITLLAVAAYFAGALVLRVNPPALAIQNKSMNPTIAKGSVAIIKGSDPRTLTQGDIIAIKLTAPEQTKYDLPREIVRRIVKITRTNGTELFITKGDGNPANDPFSVNPSAVSGKVIGSIPLLGYPILFFSSKQGIIFLAASAIILLIYYILGFLEDRRHYAHATAATMQNVLEMVGYVHDAVQENQSNSLEKLAFPGIEFQKSARQLEIDVAELLSASKTADPASETGSAAPPQSGIQAKEQITDLLNKGIELRNALDWLATGYIASDSIESVLQECVDAIENLIIATNDSDLLAILEQSKINRGPIPGPPELPPPSTFPDWLGHGGGSSPSPDSEQNTEQKSMDNDDASMDPDLTAIDGAAPSTASSNDGDHDSSTTEGETHNGPSQSQPHSMPNKRHRRRSLRRRD